MAIDYPLHGNVLVLFSTDRVSSSTAPDKSNMMSSRIHVYTDHVSTCVPASSSVMNQTSPYVLDKQLARTQKDALFGGCDLNKPIHNIAAGVIKYEANFLQKRKQFF